MAKIINLFKRSDKSYAKQLIDANAHESVDMYNRLLLHYKFKIKMQMNWHSDILP